MSDLDARADALFEEALDLPDEDRARLIATRTASDPALRDAVEQLLALAAAPAPAFDAAMAADASQHARARLTPPPPSAVTDPADGQRIGAWRVVRRVGHGGMGTVFLVERADDHYEQRGALKLVHAHAAAEDAHQRFARERRILASLDHPHVARLLDGGRTEDGRLFLVMEYVEGRPIDRFCEEERATIDRRLELFQQVCAGVQHAHDRLVVHRDLKPSNILVTEAGEVKLLDFGIAKLLSADTSEPATRLLTPEYASPEQWRGEPVAIASDVYQLGLLLYELLTGQPAHATPSKEPRSFERIICEVMPPPPSTRVASTAASDPAIGPARRVSSSALTRALSGDLDNITLFALRKEPGRRYASVRDLADDVRRHQQGRPVRARGDAVMYRAGKFIGRHRIAAAIAAVALVAVTIAIVLIAGERWRTARETAYSERVEDMLVELFSLPQAGVQQGPPRAKDYVDQAVTLVRTQFDGQPERQGRLLGQLGRAYSSLGHYQTAIDVLKQAVALREAHAGPGQAGVAQALEWLGQIEMYAGRYEQAEATLRRALSIRQAQGGVTAASTTWSMLELGDLLHTLGRLPEAERMLSDAIPILRTQPSATVPLARALTDFGNVLRDRGRLDDSEASYRESLVLFRKVLPARTAQVPLTEIYMARLLIMRGGAERLTEADALLTTNLATLRGMFEGEHPLTALALKELGYLRTEQGRLAEADARLKDAQAVIAQWLGATHPQAARTRVHQAELARRQGLAVEAIALAERTLGELAALGLTDHPAAIDARLILGEALLSERRTPEALSILNDGLARAERQFVQDDARTARFRSALSRAR